MNCNITILTNLEMNFVFLSLKKGCSQKVSGNQQSWNNKDKHSPFKTILLFRSSIYPAKWNSFRQFEQNFAEIILRNYQTD